MLIIVTEQIVTSFGVVVEKLGWMMSYRVGSFICKE